MYQTDCEHLTCDLTGAVLTMRFDRPKEENLLNYPMLTALKDVLARAANDEAVRAVVLTGNGDSFCAGDDWQDMGDWPNEFASRRPAGSHGPAPLPEQAAITALRQVMKPTIALLRGAALGLGLDLAATCDLRLATPDARIGDPRIRQGRAPATGISYLLPRLIGLSQATRILLTGEILTGEEARRIQLVHQVFDNDVFEARAEEMVQQIAQLPTRAYEVHKLQVLPQLDMNFEASLTHCLGVRQTHVIEDRIEGGKAWRERRDPKFTGR